MAIAIPCQIGGSATAEKESDHLHRGRHPSPGGDICRFSVCSGRTGGGRQKGVKADLLHIQGDRGGSSILCRSHHVPLSRPPNDLARTARSRGGVASAAARARWREGGRSPPAQTSEGGRGALQRRLRPRWEEGGQACPAHPHEQGRTSLASRRRHQGLQVLAHRFAETYISCAAGAGGSRSSPTCSPSSSSPKLDSWSRGRRARRGARSRSSTPAAPGSGELEAAEPRIERPSAESSPCSSRARRGSRGREHRGGEPPPA
jgi:hypothetical protein